MGRLTAIRNDTSRIMPVFDHDVLSLPLSLGQLQRVCDSCEFL